MKKNTEKQGRELRTEQEYRGIEQRDTEESKAKNNDELFFEELERLAERMTEIYLPCYKANYFFPTSKEQHDLLIKLEGKAFKKHMAAFKRFEIQSKNLILPEECVSPSMHGIVDDAKEIIKIVVDIISTASGFMSDLPYFEAEHYEMVSFTISELKMLGLILQEAVNERLMPKIDSCKLHPCKK